MNSAFTQWDLFAAAALAGAVAFPDSQNAKPVNLAQFAAECADKLVEIKEQRACVPPKQSEVQP